MFIRLATGPDVGLTSACRSNVEVRLLAVDRNVLVTGQGLGQDVGVA